MLDGETERSVYLNENDYQPRKENYSQLDLCVTKLLDETLLRVV